MINDFFLYDNSDLRKDIVNNSYTSAKNDFAENIPYKIYPSSVSRNGKVILFSNHFVTVFREILSSGDGAAILKMSKRERDVWYSYLEYQDGNIPLDPEMLLVVVELSNCISNEIECKTEDYLNAALDVDHVWESVTASYDNVSKTVKITQESYDTKLAALEIVDTTTYIIELNGTVIKIYLGAIEIWSQP